MAQIKGSGQPQRQADEFEWVSGVGWVTVHIWHGPTKDGIVGMATPAFLVPYSRANILSPDTGATWVLRAHFGGQGDTGQDEEVDEWELVGSGIQEDLRFHDKYRQLTNQDKGIIEKYIQDPSLLENSSPALVPDSDGGIAYAMLRDGQNAFQRSYSILRHTKTVNSSASVNVAMSDIETILGFDDLPTIENPTVATAVGNLDTEGPPFEIGAHYAWGWLKQRPHISGASFAKGQIVQEWWLYSWSTFVYPDNT